MKMNVKEWLDYAIRNLKDVEKSLTTQKPETLGKSHDVLTYVRTAIFKAEEAMECEPDLGSQRPYGVSGWKPFFPYPRGNAPIYITLINNEYIAYCGWSYGVAQIVAEQCRGKCSTQEIVRINQDDSHTRMTYNMGA